MEFIARKVVHPNGRLAKQTAEEQLKHHPSFVPGTVIVGMEQEAGKWVASLHEPKVAEAPPFGDDSESPEDAPEPPKDDAPKDDSEGDDKPKSEKSENDNKDDETGEKISLEKVWTAVEAIAQAVGAQLPDATPGLDGPGGPDLAGPDGLGPEGPPPSAGPNPMGPEGGPPHDETSAVPGHPDTKQIIHRKAPPGAVPVGAPAFASVKQAAPKIATFDVEEEVGDMPVHVAASEIESIYKPHGYEIRKIIEGRTASGARTVRARLSVRGNAGS